MRNRHSWACFNARAAQCRAHTIEGNLGDEVDAANDDLLVPVIDGLTVDGIFRKQDALADVAMSKVEMRGGMSIPFQGFEKYLLRSEELRLIRAGVGSQKVCDGRNVLGLLFKLGWIQNTPSDKDSKENRRRGTHESKIGQETGTVTSR